MHRFDASGALALMVLLNRRLSAPLLADRHTAQVPFAPSVALTRAGSLRR
jgi:hypothetical protein